MENQVMDKNATNVDLQRAELSADVAFDLLSDRDRRTIVSHLLDQNASVSLDDLVDAVAAAIESVDEPPSRDRIRVALVHNHLPRLDDAGIIEYHLDSEQVEPLSPIDDLELFLTWAESLFAG